MHTVQTIFQNGGFTKVWFSLKTVLFPLTLSALVWFWRRIMQLARPANLLERWVVDLSCKGQWGGYTCVSSMVDQPQSTCCQELGGAVQVFCRSPLRGGWLSLWAKLVSLLRPDGTVLEDPRRRNVTTLMVGLKNGHICKNLTQKWWTPEI